MNSRTTITIILAVTLMVLVMGAAVVVTLTGVASRDKIGVTQSWEQPAASAASMKVTNLTGAGKTDLFVQAGNSVLVFDTTGKLVFNKDLGGTLASSLSDVDGDGVQEIIAYYKLPQGSIVAALKATGGQTVWQTALTGLGDVGRLATVDWDGTGRPGFVVGDISGKLVALSETGKERWRYDMKATSELRGLDEVVVGKSHLIAAGDLAGTVVVLDGSGKVAWPFNVSDGLRRLRTYEVTGPNQMAVMLGSEGGTLYVLEGATGKSLWTANVGQAVTEIRPAELDGNPGTREFVVGGKRSGVWGYSQTGTLLFSANLGGKIKVEEIAALDVDASGRDTVGIGGDDGQVVFLNASGARLASQSFGSPIFRMAAGKFGNQKQFIVGDSTRVHAVTLTKQTAPFWYSPILAGLLACVVIAVVAFVIGSMRPAPALQISAEQMTVEAQRARRIMLHESIDDLKRMKAEGQVPPDAYMARLKDLRAQLADAEANLIKLGVPLKAETIRCPNCGGTLDLGTDRCEYCGQTVIT